jgi:hypothetical protein
VEFTAKIVRPVIVVTSGDARFGYFFETKRKEKGEPAV